MSLVVPSGNASHANLPVDFGSTGGTVYSDIERFFEADEPVKRRDVIRSIESTHENVYRVINYAIFQPKAKNAEEASALLAAFGRSTLSVALQYVGALKVFKTLSLPPLYEAAIWELLADSMVTAEDVPLDYRRQFLHELIEYGVPSVKAAANDAMEAME